MPVNRHKLRGGFHFRHFGKSYSTSKGPGLYFTNVCWDNHDKIRLSDKDVIKLRDWLSVYINEQILKTIPASIPEMKAQARAIERGLKKLEAECGDF